MSPTLIYAHRGANREAGENTRTAFTRALAYPIDGIETDVQLSSDGVPVLWHDTFLGKLGMPARRVEDCAFGELQEMDFALHFGRGQPPEGIMALEDFVADFRPRCHLLLEIKGGDHEDAAQRRAKVEKTLALAGAAADDRVLVSSFHLPSLIYAHERAPAFPLVYNGESDFKVRDAAHLLDAHPYFRGVCLHRKTLTPEMAELLRARGKLIAVYTCNSENDIRRALDLADILITDVPQKALQMRNT
ncbi:MAG TPA: glycerophosphodiester phosphodiesterase family protein [Gallionellaceae bacterium]|nr:glycerophosphodiester phosphodiesterase family protein [Gallionellaceae bacterium]